MTSRLYEDSIDRLLQTALSEDIGTADITTEAVIEPDARAQGRYIAKEAGVVCGLPVLIRVYRALDPAVSVQCLCRDGSTVQRGEVIATVSGPARTLLLGERVGLNLLQHLSGVATATARAVAQVAGTHTKIIDTRKTTPGLRLLEKYAVRVGGGANHRFSLSDGILIKDNHIVAAGGITAAVTRARAHAPHTLKIEVETETLSQVEEALSAGADIIMLDNMTLGQMAEAIALIRGRALTEASGNMGERDLSDVARTGVDFISIGALTHSVRALDISLKFSLQSPAVKQPESDRT
ncbi:MAG: carboxylating nicotinate-nucleotide diphosphorylase [Eubacteriales bacterium]